MLEIRFVHFSFMILRFTLGGELSPDSLSVETRVQSLMSTHQNNVNGRGDSPASYDIIPHWGL